MKEHLYEGIRSYGKTFYQKLLNEKDKEIKELYERVKGLEVASSKLDYEATIYANRINKSIEYIETHQLNFKKGTTTFGGERLSMEERKLIDILKGEENE